MDSTTDDIISIPLPEKRRSFLSFAKCIICQVDKPDVLRKAKASSIAVFVRSLQLRKDEVYDRLSEEISNLCDREVVWHSSCYSSYTSEHNIQHAKGAGKVDIQDTSNTSNRTAHIGLRSSSNVSIDWSKCFICRNRTYKKRREMNNVSTFEACKSIQQAAEKLGDEDMLRVLLSVNSDLIAAEAKYHKTCLASYISKSNLKHRVLSETNEDASDTVFKELAAEIKEGITQGRAYDMSSLLTAYRERLKAKEIAADNFSTKQRLKCRLEKYFGDSIVFHRHPDKAKPEIFYSSAISLQDVLNALAAHDVHSKSDVQEIVTTARKIKEDIKKCNGISIRPLNVDDVSLDSARRIIPSRLYWLVRIMLTSDDSGIEDFDHPTPCGKTDKERQVISIAQDIIHCASNARVKLPKQIGLAMTVRHLTGSKQLVTLLNRMGHSSSYDEVQAVDTSFATEVLAKMEAHGTVIPSNISLGPFVQLAANNNDLNEETIDGKNTTHATTMVIYQRKVFGPELPPTTPVGNHSKRRRTFKKGGCVYELQECSAYGRRPKVNQYTGAVDYQWLKDDGTVLSKALNMDVTWALLRMKPACLMETGISPENVQQVPGWGGYQSILNPAVPTICKIGYCPMIEGCSTDFTTVYTVLKHVQKVSAAMGQRDAVITFDLAIYIQAKQIQMKFPEEFSNTVVRLGGFHIALNYLSLLGKKFRSSGLEDLLIESGVYAAGTTSAIMKGKSYNSFDLVPCG